MRSLSREDSRRITHWVMNENYKQALKVSTVLFNLCRYWLFSFKKSAFEKRQIFKICRLCFFLLLIYVRYRRSYQNLLFR